jgi:hypothetical protein
LWTVVPVRSGDDYLANMASFSLLVTFVCMIMFKIATLTELRDLQARMSEEQLYDVRTRC